MYIYYTLREWTRVISDIGTSVSIFAVFILRGNFVDSCKLVLSKAMCVVYMYIYMFARSRNSRGIEKVYINGRFSQFV